MALKYLQSVWRHVRPSKLGLPRQRATNISGGSNLEVFKFGMYVMFPIGWMYYFGTNLETRFSVPDFWPEPGTTHKIPFEREELKEMSEKLKAQRLERRKKRLEQAKMEIREAGTEDKPGVIQKAEDSNQNKPETATDQTSLTGSIAKWVKGR